MDFLDEITFSEVSRLLFPPSKCETETCTNFKISFSWLPSHLHIVLSQISIFTIFFSFSLFGPKVPDINVNEKLLSEILSNSPVLSFSQNHVRDHFPDLQNKKRREELKACGSFVLTLFRKLKMRKKLLGRPLPLLVPLHFWDRNISLWCRFHFSRAQPLQFGVVSQKRVKFNQERTVQNTKM